MHVTKLLHKLLKKALAEIHLKRLTAVINAVESLLRGKRLTLTALGRSLSNRAKERHNIRLLDRLLGNQKLHEEITKFYQASNAFLFVRNKQPIITVDWSCTSKKKDWHILRASAVVRGRGIIVYQEVHPLKKLNSSSVHQRFLKTLKKVLPPDVKPILVTDAGFLCPWFKAVLKMGWHYVGRVRQKVQFCEKTASEWRYTYCLYEKATNKVNTLTDILLSKSHQITCNVVLHQKHQRGRKHINLSGSPTNNNASNRCARREREPWVLVTSLDTSTHVEAKWIVFCYAKRMQIEEDFRDSKSHQFGFGLRYSRTNNAKRLEILLLFAALAMFACWLLSLAAMNKKLHWDYQANTVRDKTVLSVGYLACRLIQKNELFTERELLQALEELRQMVGGAR